MRVVSPRDTTPRGIAAPITNAPKTACRPIQSVNHAPTDRNARPTARPGFAQGAVAEQPVLCAAEKRAEHAEREGHVRESAADVVDGVAPIAVEAREHDREQTPRGGVVDRARAERDGTHRGAREPLEVDDPREHRERRDAHRCAEEEHRLDERRLRREQSV